MAKMNIAIDIYSCICCICSLVSKALYSLSLGIPNPHSSSLTLSTRILKESLVFLLISNGHRRPLFNHILSLPHQHRYQAKYFPLNSNEKLI